jgi:TolB-like protein
MQFGKISFLCLLFTAGGLWAQQSEIVSLAVSDLAAQGVKESEAAVISEQLRAELMKSPRIRLIERTQMQEILKEQGFQKSGCTNDACAVEVGQLLGVKNIVVGSVGLAGSYTILSARIIDVTTGQVVVNESIRTKGGIDETIEKGVQAMAQKISSGLFPASTTVNTTAPPPQSKKTVLRNALIFGGGGAVLVGGGVAAYLLMNNEKNSDNTPTNNNNVRIELP